MSFNLKEYILFRTELKRELLNFEVDNNFKMVANPWVANRIYDPGNIVYHPVEVQNPTGNTGSTTEVLAWWRANKRTTQSIFDINEWDLVGGIGTGDITINAANGFGQIRVNYTGPTGSWQTANDGLLAATNPNGFLNLVAGSGVNLQYDTTTNSLKIINLGSIGEVNHGVNIGSGIDVFAGMVGTDLSFRGFGLGPTSSSALTVAFDPVNDNIEYSLNEGNIQLENLNSGSPTLDRLSDVQYPTSPANGDILQYNSGTSSWRNVSLATSGAQGPQGPQGFQGYQGFTGSGATGATGPQGFQGYQGLTGSGATGATGIGVDGGNSLRWRYNPAFNPPGGQSMFLDTNILGAVILIRISTTSLQAPIAQNATVWLNTIMPGDIITVTDTTSPGTFGMYQITNSIYNVPLAYVEFGVSIITSSGTVASPPDVDLSVSWTRQGLQGATGTQGAMGSAGFGATGATGTGFTGATGFNGATGSQGFTGATGTGGGTLPTYFSLSGSTGITTAWAGKWTPMDTNGTAAVVEIPLDSQWSFPDGSIVTIVRDGANTVQITGAGGVIINSKAAFAPQISDVYGVAVLRKSGGTGSNTWYLYGDVV